MKHKFAVVGETIAFSICNKPFKLLELLSGRVKSHEGLIGMIPTNILKHYVIFKQWLPHKHMVHICYFLCWLYSVGQNHFNVMLGMLFYLESTLQLWDSRRLCAEFKSVNSVLLHLSGWCGIPFGRSSFSKIRPDAHQCLKTSNYSKLHPSGRNGKSSKCSSEFEKIPVFQWIRPDNVAIQYLTSIRVSALRHSYRKTAATVQTMYDPVRKMSSIRKVVQIKFNRPDVSLHVPSD